MKHVIDTATMSDADRLEALSRQARESAARLREAIEAMLAAVVERLAKPEAFGDAEAFVAMLDARDRLEVCRHRLVVLERLSEAEARARSPEALRRLCWGLTTFAQHASPWEWERAARAGAQVKNGLPAGKSATARCGRGSRGVRRAQTQPWLGVELGLEAGRRGARG